MSINFKITAIENNFNHLFNLSQEELLSIGAVKMIADQKPCFPCRVSLEDAEIGEEVILFPYQHHTTSNPYQASGAIFVRKNPTEANLEINQVPKMLLHRLLSLRVYDTQGMMINAKTIEGATLKSEITHLLDNQNADYIHIHNSSQGCYHCEVRRVS